MTRNKMLLAPFAAVAALLTLAVTAYACTMYRGTFTVTGNASTGTVTSTGLRSGMVQNVSSGIAKASKTGGSVKVSTGAGGCCNKLPVNIYDVNFVGGEAYSTHTTWLNDCMDGSPNVQNLGNVNVDSTGKIVKRGGVAATQPVSFNLPAATANTGTQESGVCVSDRQGSYGNEAPITIM